MNNTNRNPQIKLIEGIAKLTETSMQEAREQKQRLDEQDERIELAVAAIVRLEGRRRKDDAALRTKMSWTIAACAGLNAITIIALLLLLIT